MMRDLSDRALLGKVPNNSEEYLTYIYDQYARKIFNLSYKMTGSKEDAEDITQKTFLQAYLSIDQFRGESRLSTWLYSIAKILCFQHLSKMKLMSFSDFGKLIQEVQSDESIQSFLEIEKEYYVSQIREGCLLGLLRCLSLNQRIAFVLYVLLDVDLMSVAAVLEKSESAVRILVHRARKNIKGFLCVHCSLYDQSNSCNCESFIHFSLERGWIENDPSGKGACFQQINTDVIAEELSEIKKITTLYSSLPNRLPSHTLAEKIQESIQGKNFFLFSSKKVK